MVNVLINSELKTSFTVVKRNVNSRANIWDNTSGKQIVVYTFCSIPKT